ncbi:hypothetical protein [Daejeonella oryzae]|uniref:hypothetical protein n=1 Tax=Daejeonella oryzae TaxID=1122943 RepID=UPI0003FD3CA1|nr:hypothetical protein [Daejeonella oryzae]
MATLDFKQVLKESVSVSKDILKKSWKNLEPYAEHEFRQFAENAEFLATLKLLGQIDEEELKARIEIQRLSLKNVLLTIEGIGLVAAQNVVNAVFSIVQKAIETALNISLPFTAL